MCNINKLAAFFVGLVAAGLMAQAYAQENRVRWVSDELTTYVRSGPTDGYRIIGTLTSGEPVTLLETSGDYSRVRSESGDTVWIRSSELQAERSIREQAPQLRDQVASLNTELEGINAEWESRMSVMTETLQAREARINELETHNAELGTQYDQARDTMRGMQARLDTQEQDLLIRYFMYGGGVAGAGLLIGLLVPHLPRRRKKNDRWF